MKLTDIIKGSEYDLSLFTEAQISELESRIVERQTKKGTEYYITCTVIFCSFLCLSFDRQRKEQNITLRVLYAKGY